MDHLQSSVLAVVRHGLPVRFPQRQPTALGDSKYLDKMSASSIVDRSIEFFFVIRLFSTFNDQLDNPWLRDFVIL